MKIVHLADLHIGKKLNGHSLLKDQEYIFNQIIKISREFNPDMILIAGDIFDRSAPSDGAFEVFEKFIYDLSPIANVYMISGNHDSGIKIGLYSDFLKEHDIYNVGEFNKRIKRLSYSNGSETADIYMLPYIDPVTNRDDFDEPPRNYPEMMQKVLEEVELDPDKLNIFLSHQFYLDKKEDLENIQEGSERIIVGGLDYIPVELLKDFDYCALGHIHGIREIGSDRIRYSGTPLKYSAGEKTKYLNLVTLTKESLKTELKELKPLRDVRIVKGDFDTVIRTEPTEDFIKVILTKQESIPNLKRRLTQIFPNLIEISFDVKDKSYESTLNEKELEETDPIDLLEGFFKSKGDSLKEEELEVARNLFEKINKELL